MERAGGEVTVQNLPDGALVRVRLPRTATPNWFYDISSSETDNVIALDDDLTIRDQLQTILKKRAVNLHQTEQDFLSEAHRSPDALLLIDYDFGGDKNGLDLILSQGLTRRAVLLSGRISFDAKIRATAEANGVRMFPKECLA